jgi:hypothetical protein
LFIINVSLSGLHWKRRRKLASDVSECQGTYPCERSLNKLNDWHGKSLKQGNEAGVLWLIGSCQNGFVIMILLIMAIDLH